MSSQPTSMLDCDIIMDESHVCRDEPSETQKRFRFDRAAPMIVVSIHDSRLDVAMREIIEQKLQLVDKLWGAKIGTPEGDELDKLIHEVEALEKKS